MRRALVATIALAVALAAVPPAGASRFARFGIQDDAWLSSGPGTLEERLDRLDALGVGVVRYTLRWDRIARRRPTVQRSHLDPAYDWEAGDGVLRGLRARGIGAVVTLLGAPRWSNGGRSAFWAPRSGTTFGNFAYAAARRYPWVKDWLIWSEPNQARWLRPTSPRVYVRRLLNPAYVQLRRATRGVRVGGGVTAPRGGRGGVSPVDWIRGMGAAHARLDAYAHHPYPLRPRVDTPLSGGCTGRYCKTITMATLERLVANVHRTLGRKRIWLTEYGYQTSPQDRVLGVSYGLQSRYVGEAALRVARAPYVDMLIHFLVQDDIVPGGWQSGLWTVAGKLKPAARAFPIPLAQVSRRGATTQVWGHVRLGSGRQPYRLRVRAGGAWRWLSTRLTDRRGYFSLRVRAPHAAVVQLWSPRHEIYSASLVVR